GKRTGFPRHALAEFVTRPQAVAQIGATEKYIRPPTVVQGRRLRGQIQIELGDLLVARVAPGVALGLDGAQVVRRDVSGHVDAVEAGSFEAGQLRGGAAHRGPERVE